MNKYTPIIGVEIHVELKTDSKMFCACKNNPDENEPNVNVCEICLAHPGTLPVPNKKAIIWTAKIAKMLKCEIAKQSKFDRKNYFYPDLPKGYQISQYDQPIGNRGKIGLDFKLEENAREKAIINITRVHLEEDTAKLIHDKIGNTLVDFNRAGIPLVEIVSEPDIRSATEAKKYCQELQLIFRYLEVSDADMEKGHMRCEANVSVQETDKIKIKGNSFSPISGCELNSKVELKNINSFRNIEKGIKYEIERQIKMIEKGEKWLQQTRGWDDKQQKTVWQRNKETSADYRYFPEPDIPPFNPIEISKNDLLAITLPQENRKRFEQEFGFSESDAYILTADKQWTAYAENVMSELEDWLENLPETKSKKRGAVEQINVKKEIARLCGGWLTSKLMGLMAEKKMNIADLKIKEENFAELICLIDAKRVNSTNALKILQEMLDSNSDKDPTHIMEEKGYGQIRDEVQLEKVVDQIIKNYPVQIEQYKAGKEQTMRFLIGMAMKATEGGADPIVIEKMLKEKIVKI
ncbi:MAG: Asp-tRNA(Asn)/Glu-tRNA(Gln) amidotransferase subunit GatB [bacterium]